MILAYFLVSVPVEKALVSLNRFSQENQKRISAQSNAPLFRNWPLSLITLSLVMFFGGGISPTLYSYYTSR
jgi:hypothetical protein